MQRCSLMLMLKKLNQRSLELFLAAGAFGAVSVAVLSVVFELVGIPGALVVDYYAANLRPSLFGGFLTVSAFLFSLKTFIVISMKDNVYGTDEYGDLFADKKRVDPTLKRYAPLSNLSDLLFASIFVSLLAALSQFTFGLFDLYLFVLLCLGLALWAIAMIFVSLFFMQENLKVWFSLLDND